MTREGVELVCLDVSGTVMRGSTGPALDGAVRAVARIAKTLPVRFVSNVTSVTRADLVSHLRAAGMVEDASHVWTPARTARHVLEASGRGAGILLVDGPVAEDFAWFREDPEGPTVLLGTEGHDLRIEALQPAFRRLQAGAELYVLQRNRYFQRDGELWTDVGPLAAFLAYAGHCEAKVLGKPSRLLFEAISSQAGVPLRRLLMVGDDAEFDVAASVELGLRAVLVRTGKYRRGDESTASPAPTATLDSLADLPRWLGLEE